MCVTVLRWLSWQNDAIYFKAILLMQEKTGLLSALAQHMKHRASIRAAELALFGHGFFYASILLWNTSYVEGSPCHISLLHHLWVLGTISLIVSFHHLA